MIQVIKIILKWNPISTQHLYWQKGKIRYMKTEAKQLKQLYDYQILAQYRWKPLEDDLILEIKLYFKDKRRRDVDNWHKLSLDAMSWKIYNDDSQIQKMVVEKFIDKLNPRIEILINKLNYE